MKSESILRCLAAASAAAAFVLMPVVSHAQAADTSSVDVGGQVPDAAAVKEGLFPEDACKELEAGGFKCMGVKPAIRYSLPASSFKVGSAELPELLKKQLDVFAEVLRGKKGGTARQIRVVGHADASGTAEANQTLSLKRAEAVKAYLIQKGADGNMLNVIGQGAKEPVNPKNPLGAENRRVVIGRDTP